MALDESKTPAMERGGIAPIQGWAKGASAVPTFSLWRKNGGHAALCPPYRPSLLFLLGRSLHRLPVKLLGQRDGFVLGETTVRESKHRILAELDHQRA